MSFQIPNFTQTPNIIFDEHMKILSGAEYKIIMAICRKTFGWQKRKDKISISQISEMTGLGSTEIKNSIKKLEILDLIQCKKAAGIITEFELNVETQTESVQVNNNEPRQKVSTPQTESVQVKSQTQTLSVHTKERIKKTIKRNRRILPESINEVMEYAKSNNITSVDIEYFWKYFTTSGWIDSNGKEVHNWKLKFLTWSKLDFNSKKEIPLGRPYRDKT